MTQSNENISVLQQMYTLAIDDASRISILEMILDIEFNKDDAPSFEEIAQLQHIKDIISDVKSWIYNESFIKTLCESWFMKDIGEIEFYDQNYTNPIQNIIAKEFRGLASTVNYLLSCDYENEGYKDYDDEDDEPQFNTNSTPGWGDFVMEWIGGEIEHIVDNEDKFDLEYWGGEQAIINCLYQIVKLGHKDAFKTLCEALESF